MVNLLKSNYKDNFNKYWDQMRKFVQYLWWTQYSEIDLLGLLSPVLRRLTIFYFFAVKTIPLGMLETATLWGSPSQPHKELRCPEETPELSLVPRQSASWMQPHGQFQAGPTAHSTFIIVINSKLGCVLSHYILVCSATHQ